MAYRQRTGMTTATQSVLMDDPDFLRLIVERVVQAILEADAAQRAPAAHLHAEPYERNAERRGYRNGYKPRMLTRVGTLTLQVPQDRDGTFSTQLFARYQRSEKALVLALMEMYVEGVSTRNVREITEVLCGTSFSKSLVSELAGQLDMELEAWRNRPLTETTYPYLSVDARYEHVRQDGRIASQGVLIVTGVRADGHREIRAVTVADTESTATYQHLFGELKARGMSGVQLVTSDAHKGLKAAIDRHFQGASWQRCQVTFLVISLAWWALGGAASWRTICATSSPRRRGIRH
jgi:putative transposase